MIDELALFETMRVVRGRVVQAEEHFARMLASSEALGFPPPERGAWNRGVARAAKRVSALREAALRCIYVAAPRVRLSAAAFPIPPATLIRRRRGRAITLAHARALPEHKLTSYAASTLGLRQARGRNADEGLFLDRGGRVLEGTTTNVFALQGETLLTARDAILPGIVRAWVLATAPRLGLRVVQRAPTIDELRGGSFLTGSLTLLAPIRVLDGVPCRAPGPAFAKLRRLYLLQ